MNYEQMVERMRVPPGKSVKLDDYNPDWLLTPDMDSLNKAKAKEQGEELLEQSRQELIRAQEILHVTGRHAVLIELQGRDAAGKDSTIKHTLSGVNPQGCEVHTFRQPTAEERAHDFLWRYRRVMPARGRIGIFNRSYYEAVMVVRVHPQELGSDVPVDPAFWNHRYEAINALEKHLVQEGTVVLKFFLHISKGEQRKKLLERLTNPDKYWKFSADDLIERQYWDDYTKAFQEAISATSTPLAPWYIVPANHKWVVHTAVAAISAHTIRALGLKIPEPTPAQLLALSAARAALELEKD